MRRRSPCTRTKIRAALPVTSGAMTPPGLPVSIRHVTNIEVLEPPAAEPADLWGILPTAGDRKPQEIIRAAWDGV